LVRAAAKEEVAAEELIPEFATEEVAEEIPSELETVAGDKVAEPAGAATDFDLVLAGGVPAAAKSAESRQIRFAEDILPGRASKAKKKKAGKKEADLPESKSKPKKTRQKRLAYKEDLEEE